ncbi:20S proteasome subunit [Spraguea lophii 42_110]|uniref:20S proteasome subunit n=1 Tax=Spraguea lophii (strain 42_110) TaxID=1358809 RepID=S7W7G3_SPRLO|nr:20S proteasome subunit [Spraguea lophii 42_110]
MSFQIDYSLTVFSSKGTLEQCDNALMAGLNGSLSVGMASGDGCVIASLKKFPLLVEKQNLRKVFKVCENIGVTFSGLQMDFRILLKKMLKMVEDYKEIYGKYPYVDVFVQNLSRIFQEYTQKAGYRPLGLLVLIVGNTSEGSFLYQMEPSGSFRCTEFCAIGKDYSEALKFLERRREKLEDNIVTAIHSIREYSGSEINCDDVDVGILQNGKFTVIERDELNDIFSMHNLEK